MQFLEEHAALVEAINAHTSGMKAQKGLFDALFNGVNSTNEKMDMLCSHATRLEKIEEYVAIVTNAVKGVENKTYTVYHPFQV